ncbi:SDR family NAD(P)-dependent oxidoreductase [Bradyrhizobium diazoefficiens]|uniref:SDR family NAD(P)-dependent oxidoreductase n=1 Tax=Bradyrhizobium diazoefficiens TaxID=1355477 RepID=UPI0034E4E660
MTHRYDAEDARSSLARAEATVTRSSGVDANATGIIPRVRISDKGESERDEMWRLNVMGPLRLVRATLPHLAVCGRGRVINLGSLSGKPVGEQCRLRDDQICLGALTHGVRREGRGGLSCHRDLRGLCR